MDAKLSRIQKITHELTNRKVVSIKELSSMLDVSEMTIRRDVAELEKNGVVEVFFGGISLKQYKGDPAGYQMEKEAYRRIEEKRRIAQKAVSLIEPLDVILLDTGTTTGFMLDYFTSDMNQIVYCYALNIINGICNMPNFKLVACGGYFHTSTRMFECEEGLHLLERTHLNKVFMAARGVSKEIGVTTAEPYEIYMKKAAIDASERKILLSDSSKFGKAWYAKYCEIDDFDTIISDTDLDPEYKAMIEDKGITLYLV